MEHVTRRATRKRRRYLPGLLVTILWMAPAMAAFGVGGFFLAKILFAEKLLEASTVQHNKVRPVRILSPEEAAKLPKDQSSHVWTEGVRDSDVPRLAPSDQSSNNHGPGRRFRRVERTPHTPAPTTTPADAAPASATTGDGESGANTSSPTPGSGSTE